MLLAVGERVLGDEVRDTVRYVTALAGGMALSEQEACGALSGGVAVIGGRFGRTNCGQDDARVQELARRFRQRFLDEFGCTQCAQVRERFEGHRRIHSCAELVEWAAGELLQIIGSAEARG